MVSSLREKRGSLAASQSEPVSHDPPVTDVEKAAAGKITQTAIGGTSSDTGNETDSSGGLERWNGSRNNTARFLVVNLALFIMGMNDACIGVSTTISINQAFLSHQVLTCNHRHFFHMYVALLS